MSVLLAACFVISGATSLILQVVWARQLAEVFGSSSLAIATVLAAFMGGLALGAHFGGRLADRLQRSSERGPLFGYAGAEAIVGLAALAIPLLLALYQRIAPSLVASMADTPLALAAVRFALCAVALSIPTTAMGATLPLLGRFVTRAKGDLGVASRRLGILYAANTAGALLGAASAGFLLIPTMGVSASGLVAAAGALSLAAGVALAAWRGGRKGDEPSLDELAAEVVASERENESSARTDMPSPSVKRSVLIAYAVSGAAAMALEVFFSRALAVVLGSSVYSFTLVLVVFLFGLSIGAALCAKPAARTAHPLTWLGAVFVLIAVGVTVSHLLIDELPTLLITFLDGTTLAISTILTIHLVLTGLVIVPVSLGLGALLPLVMRCYVGDLDRVGTDVGRAYAANTIGAICGSLLAGFVLLPLIGLELGLRSCAIVQAGLAVFMALYIGGKARPILIGLAGLAAVLALASPGWNQSDFTAGLFRGHLLTGSIESGKIVEREVVYYRDGVSTTVSVERVGSSWVLKNNGKVEASDRHDMPTQILVGLLPTVLHPGTDKDVFLVGYGSGVTVGAITQDDTVSRIDVAELEPAVLEAADRYFAEVSHYPNKDPRVHRWLGDGRNVLLSQERKYDVIISEPSNPWIAGVASLFTIDFYRMAKEHLAPGGIYCQWAQLYELGPARVKMIYNTFHQAFPYVYAFTPGDETTDTILLGSDQPIALDLEALGQRMAASPRLKAELERAFTDSPEELVASLFLVPDEIGSFTAGADINTDDNAILEHRAPRDLLAAVRGNLFARRVRSMGWPYGHLGGVITGLGDGAARAERELAMAHALLGYGRRREAATWLDRARQSGIDSEQGHRLELILRLSEPVDYADPELVVTAGGAPLPKAEADLFATKSPERAAEAATSLAEGYQHIASGHWPAAWRALGSLPRRQDSPAGRDIDLLVAYAAYKSLEDLALARRLLGDLYADDEATARRPAIAYYMGRVSYGVGAFRDGTRALTRFADGHPDLAALVLSDRVPTE